MSAAPRTTSTTAAGPAGELEVTVDEPAEVGQVRQVALICHPHPLYGGTMSNKVVHVLARTFNDAASAAVRFNFRGVGRSAGAHDDGAGETEDVLAMLEWTAQRWSGAELVLAGFSFGAAMALRAAVRRASVGRPVARLVTVAPAIRWLEQVQEASPECPWLIVQGDEDELVDASAVTAWAMSLSRPPELKILPGVDHFFHGRLNDLRDTVQTWLTEGAEH
jgi:uncharacterized protein